MASPSVASAAFEARLSAARLLTPNVRELSFERLDGQPMAFAAGQWVSAHLEAADGPAPQPGGPESSLPANQVKRSYSIASAPDGTPRFEIAVTRVIGGPASTQLHSMEPGAVVQFTGPHGFFTRSALDAAPALFIATGTGVTPMRSMLRLAAEAKAPAPTWLVLGVRREQDLLYAAEFEAIARERSFFRFEPTLSQPSDSWDGRRGYVQTHVRELWRELSNSGAGEPHAYVCGLERMVGSVRDLLRKDMGLPRQRVHTERYD